MRRTRHLTMQDQRYAQGNHEALVTVNHKFSK